jgi:hypothetical protein
MAALTRVAIVAFAALIARGTPPADPSHRSQASASRLLFVGNSLTLANNLPELVTSLARAAGRQASHEVVAFNNFSLEDHWQQGGARKAIARGDAWRAAWKRDPSLALYGPDNFHPGPMGSYLAALVIVQNVFGVSAVGLPSPGVPAEAARLLQEAARESRPFAAGGAADSFGQRSLSRSMVRGILRRFRVAGADACCHESAGLVLATKVGSPARLISRSGTSRRTCDLRRRR